MANILIGEKAQRTLTYDGIFQAEVGANTYQYKFVKETEVILDDSNVEVNRIDDGSPCYDRIGDEIGVFKFRMSNVVDLYGASTPEANKWLASHWLEQIALTTFAEVDFIQTFKGSKSAGNKFNRHRWTFRIKQVAVDRGEERGLDEINVEGTVIAFTSALREVS